MFFFLVRCHNSPFEIILGHHTPYDVQKLMTRVCSGAMIVFVSLQVLDSQSRTDFTLELRILIFVHRGMNSDPHRGLKKRKRLASSYTWPQHLPQCRQLLSVIRLPRYVKPVTHSKISSAKLVLPVLSGDRILYLFGFGCIYFAFDPGSLFLHCLELWTHVSDLLGSAKPFRQQSPRPLTFTAG